jgi:hypothetical protein
LVKIKPGVPARTGQGIDPALLSHLFERFRQADASTTRKHGGLGIGLAIVKEIVELQHGGNVRAKSSGEGKGAAFIVSLPDLLRQTPSCRADWATGSTRNRIFLHPARWLCPPSLRNARWISA